MRILVTGTSGFIGSELVNYLGKNTGHEIFKLERFVVNRYVAKPRADNQNICYASLTDYPAISELIASVKPDVVYHLGAISPVSFSYDHYLEVTQVDYLGTIHLAECCRKLPNFKQFIHASTSETYGNTQVPQYEDTQQNPNSPYAVAKLACEKYLQYMIDAYNFPVTIIRNFNTYGRKDNQHFFIERVITQMLTQDEVKLGTSSVRDLVYVDDIVRAYHAVLGNPKAPGEIFNVATGRAWDLRDVVEILRKLTGFTGKITWNTLEKRPLDIDVLHGNADKIYNKLGFRCKIDLQTGLKLTVDHWKNKLQKEGKLLLNKTA